MIEIFACDADGATLEVVSKAFERSFTRGQCRLGERGAPARETRVFVVLAPADADAAWLTPLLNARRKLVLLGRLGPRIAEMAGLSLTEVTDVLEAQAQCAPAPLHGGSESAATLVYADGGLGGYSPLRRRPFCRFDFTDEWNNLGFGRIGFGHDAWSIAVTARASAAEVVADVVAAERAYGAAATLRDLPAASILWCARPVGPLDGPDWAIIEAFIADHRARELPCRPYLRDVPHGVGAAATMRLDCDEAVASARPLFELYRARGLPLSLAIKTGQELGEADIDLMRDVAIAGGAILSHSQTHAPNWGGSAPAAEAEALASQSWLERHLPGLPIRYAVSPFHQTPTFVPAALARVGYRGVVAGTISSHPEYLMARGGVVPFGPRGFVSHSQSCMLHGDCLREDGDRLAVYKQAFRNAMAAGQFFGYLDHPFSARYSYGWSDEAERLAAHAALLDFMREECAQAGAPLLFVDETTCLDFMLEKADCEIEFDTARDTFALTRTRAAGLPLSIGFRGQTHGVAGA
jgi:hypothetical protein